LIALTRAVSPLIGNCELTHLPRVPIDVDLARSQHAGYERALERLGCSVRRVAPAPEMPDSVFIEDTAVVLDEIAIVMRPGVASRAGEPAAVTDALASYRPLASIEPPGTLDGGDVLVVNRSIFVGASGRANQAGIDQLRAIAAPFGYALHVVGIRRCLHLKSAVTALPGDVLLLNADWVTPEAFAGFEHVEIDPDEPAAANVVRVGGQVLVRAVFPRTADRLTQRGFSTVKVTLTELAKAEGALTCCSLIFHGA
jgi:dimethylargininase